MMLAGLLDRLMRRWLPPKPGDIELTTAGADAGGLLTLVFAPSAVFEVTDFCPMTMGAHEWKTTIGMGQARRYCWCCRTTRFYPPRKAKKP